MVEVDVKRHNPRQSPGWCVRVEDAYFFRPWTPSRSIEPERERERSVLMPRHQPIRLSRFLEARPPRGSLSCAGFLHDYASCPKRADKAVAFLASQHVRDNQVTRSGIGD